MRAFWSNGNNRDLNMRNDTWTLVKGTDTLLVYVSFAVVVIFLLMYTRSLFLTAPLRAVSCYGDKATEEHAWHDYFTDHGGVEGRPDIEETVDVGQLEWSAAQVHAPASYFLLPACC